MASETILTKIGERLRMRRKQMGLTQDQAAEMLKISTNFYGEVERGNRRLSIEKIMLVYEKMGLEPTYLLTGERMTDHTIKNILKDCPEDKVIVVEQILRSLTMLYR